jgi:arylsulfate sulfotransferase
MRARRAESTEEHTMPQRTPAAPCSLPRRTAPRTATRLVSALAVLAAAGGIASAASLTVSLSASPSGSAPLGTMITWTAQASGADAAGLRYRFRVRDEESDFRMVRDYSPLTSLAWTAADEEGISEVEVSVLDLASGDVRAARASIRFQSRVTGRQPTVNPTAHPLVFLFSSPPCGGGTAHVEFASQDGPTQTTPSRLCSRSRSFNIYLAGLQPATAYSARLVADRGRNAAGPEVSFTTGASAASVVLPIVAPAVASTSGRSQPVLLQATLGGTPFATDLEGNLIWYGPSGLAYATAAANGGRFFGIGITGDITRDFVREFDLVGMTVRETTVERVNRQLARLGKRAISGFHHEARTLPGDRIVILADVEQILTDVQGPGPVDVIGDMIIVFDSDLRVVWTWDTFDHLDPTRAAILGETCVNAGTCAPHYLSTNANDWTHGNAVQPTPDGDLIYSSRHQDWVLKVRYRNGRGNGAVMWTLGKGGDFTLDPDLPDGWFSHQHDPNFDRDDSSTIDLFDNGNTRQATVPTSTSRGQSIRLDEDARVAHLMLNVDFGKFSIALGSAQRLENGDVHFDLGWVYDPAVADLASTYSVEVDPDGAIVDSIQTPSRAYRTIRMRSLYGVN